ncbi:MAG: hypothetical protein KDD22_06185, partial [Bdellovibrionales bacterium]|nr:hypothetical protein [Bdellovibrionales bacterium]
MTAFRAVLYSSRRRVQTVAVFTLTLLFLLINSAEKSQAYTLQGSWMNQVNWLYVGYAPRMNDPARVSVTISKQGFTARVHMQLNDEDIIDYPKYLIRRKNQIEAKIKKIIDDPYQLIVFTRKETRQAYL